MVEMHYVGSLVELKQDLKTYFNIEAMLRNEDNKGRVIDGVTTVSVISSVDEGMPYLKLGDVAITSPKELAALGAIIQDLIKGHL